MTSPVKRLRGSCRPLIACRRTGWPILAHRSRRIAPAPRQRYNAPGTGGTMRFLGIDFGEKRIGLAISDPAGRLALPLTTLERRNDRSALRQIAEIARQEGVERLVLGEPVDLYGRRGPHGRAGPALRRPAGRDDGAPGRVGGRGADQRRGRRAAAPGGGRHRGASRGGSTRSPPRSCCRTPWTGKPGADEETRWRQGKKTAAGRARNRRGGSAAGPGDPAAPAPGARRPRGLVLVDAAAPLQGIRGARGRGPHRARHGDRPRSSRPSSATA